MSALKKLTLAAAAGYAGVAITRAIVRRKRDFDWRNKRVIITGGSRGLGLVIARQLAAQGARIAITARAEEDLNNVLPDTSCCLKSGHSQFSIATTRLCATV